MIRYCIMYSGYAFVGEFWISANDGDTPYVIEEIIYYHVSGTIEARTRWIRCTFSLAELLPASNVLVCH